ncbi:MAG: TlpA family protein disulfide reductase [Bacteroidia bacterium]
MFTLYSCASKGAHGGKDNPKDSLAAKKTTPEPTLKDDDIIKLYEFNINDFQKEQNPATARDIKLQKVGIADLKKMAESSGYTWIVVWASWCPHCREGIKQYPGTTDKVKKMEDMNMILVAEDYNLPAIQDRLFEVGYKKQAYVLDPEEFGMDEQMKIANLRKYLCPTCAPVDAVVPQHYLFNKNGQIVLDEVGGDLTDIDIMTAIHSQ